MKETDLDRFILEIIRRNKQQEAQFELTQLKSMLEKQGAGKQELDAVEKARQGTLDSFADLAQEVRSERQEPVSAAEILEIAAQRAKEARERREEMSRNGRC